MNNEFRTDREKSQDLPNLPFLDYKRAQRNLSSYNLCYFSLFAEKGKNRKNAEKNPRSMRLFRHFSENGVLNGEIGGQSAVFCVNPAFPSEGKAASPIPREAKTDEVGLLTLWKFPGLHKPVASNPLTRCAGTPLASSRGAFFGGIDTSFFPCAPVFLIIPKRRFVGAALRVGQDEAPVDRGVLCAGIGLSLGFPEARVIGKTDGRVGSIG